MGKTKTFRQIIDGGYQYPSSVDAATQATILDWYQFRHVTDDEKFGTYFSRVLNRDYHRYRQLLRIEPGIKGDTGFVTNFDWMVSEYLEKMDEIEYNEGVSGTSTDTENGTKTSTGSSEDSGSDTLRKSGSDTTQYGKTSANTESVNTTTSKQGKTDSSSASESRAQGLARSNPMSQSYTDAQMDAYSDKALDIKEITDSHDNFAGYTIEEGISTGGIHNLHEKFPAVKINNPTTSTDSYTANGSIAKARDEGNTSTIGVNGSTSSDSGSDSINYNTTDTNTYGKRTDNENSTTDTKVKMGSSESTNEGSSTYKTRHSGRTQSPQELLEKAKAYIETTSAWEWLKEQLDVCFMSNLDY